MHRVWLGVDSGLGTMAAISMILRSGSRDVQIHQGKSWPCMHRVWIQCDSGVTVTKQTRHDVVSCKRSILAFPRAKFSTRVDLDLEASRTFRPTPRERIWSNFVQSYFVRCQDLGIQVLTPVSRECTVSGLMESIRAFRSESSSGIM